jgi:transcriptional regulator
VISRDSGVLPDDPACLGRLLVSLSRGDAFASVENSTMYIPPAFRVEDFGKLTAFIQQHSFATVVTHDGSAPFASHLPMLFRPEIGERGTLVSHMARANPQWKHFTAGIEVLAVFHAPHTYISPSWYQSGPAVPTWNYAAVHAYVWRAS